MKFLKNIYNLYFVALYKHVSILVFYLYTLMLQMYGGWVEKNLYI